MKALLRTFLLFALLSAVASLTCHSCHNLGKKCEPRSTQQCVFADSSCVSAIIEIQTIIMKINYAFKSCIPTSYCDLDKSTITFDQDVHVRTRFSCCNKDKCNKASAKLPKYVYNVNRRYCPFCLQLNEDECMAESTVNCTGNEDHCLAFEGNVHFGFLTGEAAFQACATEDLCMIKRRELIKGNGVFNIEFFNRRCTPAEYIPFI